MLNINLIKQQVKPRHLIQHLNIPLTYQNFVNCVVHSDTNPSCRVYDELFHCFACNTTYDVIHFVQKYFGISFADALSYLNTEFNISDTERYTQPIQHKPKQNLQRLYSQITSAYLSFLHRKQRLLTLYPEYAQCFSNQLFSEYHIQAEQLYDTVHFYPELLTDQDRTNIAHIQQYLQQRGYNFNAESEPIKINLHEIIYATS